MNYLVSTCISLLSEPAYLYLHVCTYNLFVYICLLVIPFVSFCQFFFRSLSWPVIKKKKKNYTCMYLLEISVYLIFCFNIAICLMFWCNYNV